MSYLLYLPKSKLLEICKDTQLPISSKLNKAQIITKINENIQPQQPLQPPLEEQIQSQTNSQSQPPIDDMIDNLIEKTESCVIDENKYKDNFIKAIAEIKSMPYIRNSASASGETITDGKHETAIANILLKHKFVVYNGEKITKQMLKDKSIHSTLKVGEFIIQPFGTQSSPDFIIKISSKSLILLEAKSSKENHPQYNSGGIKPHYLYVFTSKKSNQTTIYMGSSIVKKETLDKIKELIEKQRILEKETNILLQETDEYNRGVTYYTRPMIIQSGGKGKTDYFNHKTRKETEANVITYINSLP